jgi:hypothetical protein
VFWGSFTGTGPDVINKRGNTNTSITIFNNVSKYSLADLAKRHKNFTGTRARITGFTDSAYPEINYTARDLNDPLEVLKAQVHELGHSLDVITGVRYKDQYEKAPARTTEAGFKLEDCVVKGKGFKFKR